MALAVVAVVAVAAFAVTQSLRASDAFPTSTASLPPRLNPTAEAGAPTASGAAADIALTTDGIGELAFGTPPDEAVEQLTEWLGAPDEGPVDFFCQQTGEKVGDHYMWDGLVILMWDGGLNTWVVSTELGEPAPNVRLDVGVDIGSTVADLQRVFGDQLQLYDEEVPGAPPIPAFVVNSTDDEDSHKLVGSVTGHEPADRVEALRVGSPCPESLPP
jgi:hypothetical protein